MTVKRVPTVHYAKTDAHDMWAAREEFTTSGAMRGEYINAVWGETTGRLNADEAARLISDSAKANEMNGRLYVVFSYATPIGWVVIDAKGNDHSVYRVSQKFSVTTSKHQGRLY